ncbi:hypothetical protein EV127DRAFT_430388 [Xylaria flabelliformis]|nr:hypothetical protein EV127DRAFT_430388 [Xylaria flabelliformis]
MLLALFPAFLYTLSAPRHLLEMEICQDSSPNPAYELPPLSMRSNIFDDGGGGYLVTYPSTGGIVIAAAPLPADLAHLGLSQTRDTERSNATSEEDDIANRMLQLGANWWPDWDTYARHRERVDQGILYDFHFPPDMFIGYPSTGGVWVSKFSADLDQSWAGGEESSQPRMPKVWRQAFAGALTMDDKCKVMEDLGAVFYANVGLCPDVAQTVDQGKEMFGRYSALLRNMEDPGYLARWQASKGKGSDRENGDDFY